MSQADLEATGNGLQGTFTVGAALLSLVEDGRLDQPGTRAEGAGVGEGFHQLLVSQVGQSPMESS